MDTTLLRRVFAHNLHYVTESRFHPEKFAQPTQVTAPPKQVVEDPQREGREAALRQAYEQRVQQNRVEHTQRRQTKKGTRPKEGPKSDPPP